MSVAVYIGFAVAIAIIVRLAVACRGMVKEQRHTDALTGLRNRAGFEAIVAEYLTCQLPFGIVWLDLDGFRKLNELHGYASGDALLGQMGPRIRACLRPGDAVARFGGDQFLILIRGHEAIAGITGRILGSIKASAGVSLYPDHSGNVQELLRFAETAMRKTKSTSRGRLLFYEASMAANTFRGSEIANLIQSALTDDHFRLVYQPIVDHNGIIVRMEALVRIDDPVLGRVPPVEFIGVAEQTGLIHEVGAWILRNACQQARDWRDSGYKIQVTINLSPLQLASQHLADNILREIARYSLDNSAITVHITGVARSAAPIDSLRAAGIHVSSQQWNETDATVKDLFDGFRTKSPFRVPENSPKLTVIAQGIEEPVQLDQARAAGCQLFQGFLIAPPLEPGDATEILRTGLFSGGNSRVQR